MSSSSCSHSVHSDRCDPITRRHSQKQCERPQLETQNKAVEVLLAHLVSLLIYGSLKAPHPKKKLRFKKTPKSELKAAHCDLLANMWGDPPIPQIGNKPHLACKYRICKTKCAWTVIIVCVQYDIRAEGLITILRQSWNGVCHLVRMERQSNNNTTVTVENFNFWMQLNQSEETRSVFREKCEHVQIWSDWHECPRSGQLWEITVCVCVCVLETMCKWV